MSKWVIDTQSGTILNALHCVIIDDATLSEEDHRLLDDEQTLHVAEFRGIPVLSYRNPEQIHISWDIEDVQTLCMNMTDEQALEALQKVSKPLRDESISFGWQVLEIALASAGYEITIDEEKN